MFHVERYRRTRGPYRKQRGAIWADWALLLVGVGFATAAGTVVSHAWLLHNTVAGCAAALIFTCGLLLAVSGMRTHRARVPIADAEALQAAMGLPLVFDTDGLPRLGEMLVYKYHLISERDLKRALARQAESGKRLGEVLVEMGRVSWLELARALEDQLSYGDPWRVR